MIPRFSFALGLIGLLATLPAHAQNACETPIGLGSSSASTQLGNAPLALIGDAGFSNLLCSDPVMPNPEVITTWKAGTCAAASQVSYLVEHVIFDPHNLDGGPPGSQCDPYGSSAQAGTFTDIVPNGTEVQVITSFSCAGQPSGATCTTPVCSNTIQVQSQLIEVPPFLCSSVVGLWPEYWDYGAPGATFYVPVGTDVLQGMGSSLALGAAPVGDETVAVFWAEDSTWGTGVDYPASAWPPGGDDAGIFVVGEPAPHIYGIEIALQPEGTFSNAISFVGVAPPAPCTPCTTYRDCQVPASRYLPPQTDSNGYAPIDFGLECTDGFCGGATLGDGGICVPDGGPARGGSGSGGTGGHPTVHLCGCGTPGGGVNGFALLVLLFLFAGRRRDFTPIRKGEEA